MTRKRALEAALLASPAAILIVALLLAKRGVYAWEEAIFGPINDLPDALYPFVWVVNQYGTIVTIPMATIFALAFRRWRLAGALAVSGVAVYFLAKVVKEYVQRGRPGALLAAVNERETFARGSLGFPSGHAAVSAAITIVVLAFLGMPWRIAAIALAVAVPLSRMYVGAHLPLDLIGGAAMGVAIASVMVATLGRHPRHSQGQRAPPQTR